MSMVTKFVLWSIVLLALVTYTGIRAIWNNQNAATHDFTYWQDQYKDIAYQLATDPKVKEATKETPIEVKQVTVIQFNLLKQDGTTQLRVDRCESCHIGLLNPQMTAENIIKVVDGVTVPTAQVAQYLEDHPKTREEVLTVSAHPGIDIEGGGHQQDLGVVHGPHLLYGVTTNSSPTPADLADYAIQKTNLQQHPFPTFGCTVCHYGSGRELIQMKAHGDPEHWLSPLLPDKYMDAACAQCHATYDPKSFSIHYLPVMQTITRGEQLFKQQACYGCHKIDGFSKGNIGPELTFEGRSTEPVAIEHQLWDPRYKVGTCVMPFFFSVRQINTDMPGYENDIVDPRAKTVVPALITDPDTRASLAAHGYIPDASKQADVDALVTFVYSQTGLNYAESQASRFTAIAAYNQSQPADVPVTETEGKTLFENSGCYACHYIGNPNVKHQTGDAKFGRGGIFGPELSWEGTRHSQQWLIAHYKNPQAFVPGSIMPIFPLSDSARAALSLYDSSLKSNSPNARPVSADEDMPTGAVLAQGAQTPDIRYMTR